MAHDASRRCTEVDGEIPGLGRQSASSRVLRRGQQAERPAARSRTDFYQDFIVRSDRLFNLFPFKNIGRTVAVINDRFHEFLSGVTRHERPWRRKTRSSAALGGLFLSELHLLRAFGCRRNVNFRSKTRPRGICGGHFALELINSCGLDKIDGAAAKSAAGHARTD